MRSDIKCRHILFIERRIWQLCHHDIAALFLQIDTIDEFRKIARHDVALIMNFVPVNST